MQPVSYLLKPANKRIQKFIYDRTKHAPKWWTPVWRGLVADPESKHRKAMGSSVWMYLYLLTYANRNTGVARRRLAQIREDTGYPVRTIQRHLKRLVERQYISLSRSDRYLHIQIKKWKSFNIPHDKSL
jgi:hypothetical protein